MSVAPVDPADGFAEPDLPEGEPVTGKLPGPSVVLPVAVPVGLDDPPADDAPADDAPVDGALAVVLPGALLLSLGAVDRPAPPEPEQPATVSAHAATATAVARRIR